jgi:septal ring factor EnvC (AmiA/AmiB activator)
MSQSHFFKLTLFALLGLAVTTFVLLDTLSERHDLYNPARTALVNARQYLSESFSQEQDVLEQLKRIHHELDESLRLLARAEEIDPTVKAQVDVLRARLTALEDQRTISGMDKQTLRDTDQTLLRDFEELIQHY